MHSVAKGDISTAALTLRFLQLGYQVLKPVSENCKYDLVIERGKGFERVQCKTARLVSGVLCFNTYSTNGANTLRGPVKTFYNGHCELFGVYSPHTEKCYLVSLKDLGGGGGRLRIEPPKIIRRQAYVTLKITRFRIVSLGTTDGAQLKRQGPHHWGVHL